MKKIIIVLLIGVAVLFCCKPIDNTEKIGVMNSETERTVYLEAVKDGTIRPDREYFILPSEKTDDGLITQYEIRYRDMFEWRSVYVDVY